MEIWMQIQHYFNKNEIKVNLKHLSFNMNQDFGEPSLKISMYEDMEAYLYKSPFDFIYKLLCSGTNPAKQFSDIQSALNHRFIKKLSEAEERKNLEFFCKQSLSKLN
jgi:hypothetical protein